MDFVEPIEFLERGASFALYLMLIIGFFAIVRVLSNKLLGGFYKRFFEAMNQLYNSIKAWFSKKK